MLLVLTVASLPLQAVLVALLACSLALAGRRLAQHVLQVRLLGRQAPAFVQAVKQGRSVHRVHLSVLRASQVNTAARGQANVIFAHQAR